MSLAKRANALSLKLIKKHGRPVSFFKESNDPSVANPHRGNSVTTASVDQDAVFIDYTEQEKSLDRNLEGQKKLLTSHVNTSLEGYTFVQDGDIKWAIKFIKIVQPGLTPIMYEMRVSL